MAGDFGGDGRPLPAGLEAGTFFQPHHGRLPMEPLAAHIKAAPDTTKTSEQQSGDWPGVAGACNARCPSAPLAGGANVPNP